jgi:hypothetical protein
LRGVNFRINIFGIVAKFWPNGDFCHKINLISFAPRGRPEIGVRGQSCKVWGK